MGDYSRVVDLLRTGGGEGEVRDRERKRECVCVREKARESVYGLHLTTASPHFSYSTYIP